MKENISSAIIESMSDGLIVLNFHGHITRMNPAASKLLDIKMEETEDRTYAELFLDEPENDAFNDLLLDGIQNSETRLYREVPFIRKDGHRLDLAVTTSFLRAEIPEAEKVGIVVVFKDITESKALDRARRRVIDHLSHELRTPLSIILTSLKRLASQTKTSEKALERIRRNLKRLQDVQMEVEDIVKHREFKEKHEISVWLQQTLDFIELLEEENTPHKEALHYFRSQFEDFFRTNKSHIQDVKIAKHIDRVMDSARQFSAHRAVSLLTKMDIDPLILIDPDVLEKALMSLLKNAIENTPDGGEVLISLLGQPGHVELEIKDSGVGITEESQKQIFGGFYHSKETDLYSTKKPFDFGAGGKGLDLLRLKIFSDTYHFQVECRSTRCRYIPRENDLCPGVIANCPHVQNREQCAQSGGTAFKLLFPLEKKQSAESREHGA
jgi:PAS domain S-box-containing protein